MHFDLYVSFYVMFSNVTFFVRIHRSLLCVPFIQKFTSSDVVSTRIAKMAGGRKYGKLFFKPLQIRMRPFLVPSFPPPAVRVTLNNVLAPVPLLHQMQS